MSKERKAEREAQRLASREQWLRLQLHGTQASMREAGLTYSPAQPQRLSDRQQP